MPHTINVNGTEYQLKIYPDEIYSDGIEYWNVDYKKLNSGYINYHDKSLLNAVFYMICHLLEHGYMKGETK